jgi:hypothetical protein
MRLGHTILVLTDGKHTDSYYDHEDNKSEECIANIILKSH